MNEEYFSDNDSTNTENIIDDSEDELINIKNYTKIIKSLVQYNNNVYLSATIDKTENFEYYNKDIRYMIENKYFLLNLFPCFETFQYYLHWTLFLWPTPIAAPAPLNSSQ